MAKTAKLTEKQQRFVEEIPVDLNATQAANSCGYSAKQQISKVQGCWQMSRFNRQ